MKNKSKNIGFFLLIIPIIFLFKEVNAESYDKCSKFNHPEGGLTLQGLVKKSDYIGLFTVTEAQINSQIKLGKEVAYTYKLVNEFSLKGDPPLLIELNGLEPYERIPPFYFSIFKTHENYNPQDISSKGITWAKKEELSGECRFSPDFVIGYSYLIFSYESRVSYEPIFSIEFDKWFQIVKQEIDNQDK